MQCLKDSLQTGGFDFNLLLRDWYQQLPRDEKIQKKYGKGRE